MADIHSRTIWSCLIHVHVAKFSPYEMPLNVSDHHRAANFRVFLVI
jgi:hypothetical protein